MSLKGMLHTTHKAWSLTMSLNQYRPKGNVRGDMAVLLCALGLSLIGLLVISSASVVVSYEQFGTNNVFLAKQAIAFIIGCIGLISASLIDYRRWRQWATPLLIVSILAVLAVHLPFGISIGGARRWIEIGPFLFQPSELLKLSFILFTAAWLDKKGSHITDLRKGIIPFGILMLVMMGIIIIQKDLGTTLVVTVIGAVMVFISGARIQHLVAGLCIGLVLFYGFIRIESFRYDRLMSFLNPQADVQGAGYQINQARLAIGSGNVWGLGFGQSRQKYLYLPQVQTDAIFAIMVEELGFVRVIGILLIFIYMAVKGFRIARRAPDRFSKLVACGIASWIIFQLFVNISGIMGLIPLTGIPIPFISYGGSSLVVLLLGAGILYNISRNAKAHV